MLKAQKHRGPDATGKFSDPGYGCFGHNRLSIIDLSESANQPFFDNSGRYMIVFNGEIYNYLEIKEALKNRYDFKTQSDTEVLLAAFIMYGKECLSKLNGMFSFAIWDIVQKKLFAARDRFGVKPFFYSQTAEAFYFSSEIKAVFAAGVPKIPNREVWAAYFAFGSYGNPSETFWENICQLPGGYFLEMENNSFTIQKWYCFENEVQKYPENWNYEDAKQRYLELLKDSMALRFRADVAVGFNISGGLDSSVLLAMVNHHEKDQENVNAYTFYTGDPDYDEVTWAGKMIRKTGFPFHKILFEAKEVPLFSKQIQLQQDEPYGGIPTLAYAKIFENARKKGTTVLLDGQGMDEQWVGYDYYLQQNEVSIQGVEKYPFKANMLSDSFLKMAVKPEYPKPFADEVLNKQFRDLFYTKIPRALRFNDRVSMAFSTELREPFLDYRLVEMAFSLPLEFKVKDGKTKYMLRDIAAGYIDPELFFQGKRPIQTPQREWLCNELQQWVIDNFNEIKKSKYAHWFNFEEIDRELESFFEGNNDSSFHIWQYIGFNQVIQSLCGENLYLPND